MCFSYSKGYLKTEKISGSLFDVSAAIMSACGLLLFSAYG